MYLIEMYIKEKYIKMYLDYVNNFTTVQGFAYYYNITTEKAKNIINVGKNFHENNIFESPDQTIKNIKNEL